mgnify:CR=1 FL=1
MLNAMNKVLRDCVPDITMPFLDDIPIKGCPIGNTDESVRSDGCRKFITDHINDCEKVLQRLESTLLRYYARACRRGGTTGVSDEGEKGCQENRHRT